MKNINVEKSNTTNSALHALELNGFAKKYRGNKEYTVKDITFAVEKGSFHGFIGANGAGKTTTIKSLVGAYAKFEGDVKVFGDKSSLKIAKAKIGYIPEKANFPKQLTCFQYIWRMAYISGYPKQEAKKYAKEKIEELGLQKYGNKSPEMLSSGQKKKVLLAQALAHQPELIIMDEPAANLDPKARSDFFNTLKKLQKKGIAIFMSSHILAELQEFVDSITILDQGKVLYSGSVKEMSENKDLSYEVKFYSEEHMKKFKSFLKTQKLSSKINEESLIVIFKTHINIQKALSYIAKNKLEVAIFATTKKSLQEIYDVIVNSGEGASNA